jgi:hypothetical protein
LGHGSLFAHGQGPRFYGYKPIDRQTLLAFAREVSSVALSQFQQKTTRVAVGDASTDRSGRRAASHVLRRFRLAALSIVNRRFRPLRRNRNELTELPQVA